MLSAQVFDYASWLSERYPEVSPRAFYRDLFPLGTLPVSREPAKGEYPAVAVVIRPLKNLRITVIDDLSGVDEALSMAEPGDLCVMSPVSYAGMSQRKSMAHALHAFVFDVDGLKVSDGEPKGLNQLIYQSGAILDTAAAGFAIPLPTYIVASGTGIHLYYLLDEPLVLWPDVMERVEAYRAALTLKIWNRYATDLWESVQYEGATQCFRMVGAPIKPVAGFGVARAFLTGGKVSVGYMDGFVPESARIGGVGRGTARVPINEAKERWPEWYRTRVVEGVPRATWRAKRDLYDWWVRRVEGEGRPGHRYNCIVALAAYARKCGIPRDELERDAMRLRRVLDERDASNPFTERDVRDALTAYRPGMVRYPVDEIVRRAGIPIEKNKRNFRSQEKHLMGARAIRDINNENWRAGNGRKPKRDLVRSYAIEHPEANHSEIARALGISRPTVIKWLKGWGDGA